MNCHEFECELDRCVEEKAAPTSQVIDHASACTTTTCCERWEEFEVLSFAIDAWLKELPQVDLTDNLLAMHDQSIELDEVEVLSTRTHPRRLESNDRFPAAMAAVVSLLVTACLLIAISIAPSSPQLAKNESKLLEQVSQEIQLVEFGKTTAELMNGATSHVTSTVAMAIPAEMSSTSAWLDMWSERLEPLEDKFDSTVRDFMKETLSDMTDSAS